MVQPGIPRGQSCAGSPRWISGGESAELCTAIIEVENYGSITVELDASAAPETVENFVALAEDGFYD